jgi:hypothetical protein
VTGDKCVLGDKLMLHRFHSNIRKRKESSAKKQKYINRMF